MNRNELIYREIRHVDEQGKEIAKVLNGAIEVNRGELANSELFHAIRKLRPGEIYTSAISSPMRLAMPVYDTTGAKLSTIR
jgi:hypothetical protein